MRQHKHAYSSDHGRDGSKFESIQDFLSRIESRSLNKRGVEALVQGGAFDKFGFPRKGIFEKIPDLIEDAKELKQNKNNSQGSLFDLNDNVDNETIIENIEWEKKDYLDREREMLGFFVSEDPLDGYGEVLRSESTHSITELLEFGEDEEVNVTISGLFSNVQKRVSRRGNPWIQFDVQDITGTVGVREKGTRLAARTQRGPGCRAAEPRSRQVVLLPECLDAPACRALSPLIERLRACQRVGHATGG